MIALGKSGSRAATESWKLESFAPAEGWERWLEGKVGRKGYQTFRVRLLVQAAFAVTCVLLGAQFARFVTAAREGAVPLPHRPAGVEGFLPISGLLGLVDWVRNGSLNPVHPAATMILLVVLGLSLLLRKSFCSWICPVGFLSEALARLGRGIFGRNFRIWRALDVPLRGLKYFLLFFFVWAILGMTPAALRAFIESPYNTIADVKTGMFFVELGSLGAAVLLGLSLLSVLYKGFWCRYLCPYGALLGLFSWLSPAHVRRDPVSCIDCGLCDRVCMARLPVSRKINVLSPECTGCLDCVAVCPIRDALGVHVGRRRWEARQYAAAVLALFLAGYLGARVFGLWENRIGDAEYVEHLRQDAVQPYGHPGR
ncbi:MAG TPA: 4Fe-4S binding protein [Acidobacteria bacterium]|nr:4Fe-4S binding protein [Acidobacteriota bacterium]